MFGNLWKRMKPSRKVWEKMKKLVEWGGFKEMKLSKEKEEEVDTLIEWNAIMFSNPAGVVKINDMMEKAPAKTTDMDLFVLAKIFETMEEELIYSKNLVSKLIGLGSKTKLSKKLEKQAGNFKKKYMQSIIGDANTNKYLRKYFEFRLQNNLL